MTHHLPPILPPEEPPASGWRETAWFLIAMAVAALIGGGIAKLEHFLT